MSYMAKDERRAAIVDAAMRVALRDGLMNITTRKVSAEMNAATGIVHHHFSSTADLRREVFQYFVQEEHRRACERIQGMTPAAQLLSLLDYSGSTADDPDSRLWNDSLDRSGAQQDVWRGLRPVTAFAARRGGSRY